MLFNGLDLIWLELELLLVKACTIPYPMAYFFHQGFIIRVRRAEELNMEIEGVPGQIIDFSDHSITVKCGRGAILLLGVLFPSLPPPCNIGDLIY